MMGELVREMVEEMVDTYTKVQPRAISMERVAFTFLVCAEDGGPEPALRFVRSDMPINLVCTLMGRKLAQEGRPLFGMVLVYFDVLESLVQIEGVSIGNYGYRASWPTMVKDNAFVMDQERKPRIKRIKAEDLACWSTWIEYIEAIDMAAVMTELLLSAARGKRRDDTP